jgi:O-antigen ligase
MLQTLAAADRARLLGLTQGLVFASVLLVILMPFSAPLLVGGAFIVQAGWHFRDHGTWLPASATSVSWTAAPMALLLAYFAVRLLPGPISADAATGVLAMVAYTLLAGLTLRLQSAQTEDVQAAIARAFLAAFFVGAAVHAFEVVSGFAGRRVLWTLVPGLRPRAAKLVMEGASVAGVAVFIANHVSAILAALIVPVAMLANRGGALGLSRVQAGAAWLSIAVAAAAIFLSDHATSKLALVVMGVTWLLLRALPRAALPVLGAAWVAAVLAVLPAALTAYHAEAYRWPKAFSAQHRIVIWGVTAERALQTPVFGIGIGQIAQRDESELPNVPMVPGTRFPIATAHHSHNMFLQTWYEAGGLGALLLLIAGVPLLRAIGRAPAALRPWYGAAFLGTTAAASLSYSLIAGWFLATFAATLLFCRFAALFYRDGDAAA